MAFSCQRHWSLLHNLVSQYCFKFMNWESLTDSFHCRGSKKRQKRFCSHGFDAFICDKNFQYVYFSFSYIMSLVVPWRGFLFRNYDLLHHGHKQGQTCTNMLPLSLRTFHCPWPAGLFKLCINYHTLALVVDSLICHFVAVDLTCWLVMFLLPIGEFFDAQVNKNVSSVNFLTLLWVMCDIIVYKKLLLFFCH